MKDEIKEILEYIQKYTDKYETTNLTEIRALQMGYVETVLLLDYITNLQTIEQQYSAILSENAELEQKYDMALEDNVKESKRRMELQEENEEWHMIFDGLSERPYAHRYLEEKRKELGNDRIIGLDSEMVYKDYYDLREKIDKVIKYLEAPNRDNFDYCKAYMMQILQGKSDE